MVSGNNDFFTSVPAEKIVAVGHHRIFMSHGHRYGVSFDTLRIKEAAREHGCDMAFFGHTHRPVIDMNDDVVAVNPGSISYPVRKTDGRPIFFWILTVMESFILL